LEKDFVYSTLALSPVTATGAGYHQHQGVVLDELLDDYSPAGLERKRRLYRDFEQRLGGLDAGRLSAEEKADLAILNDQIGLGLLDLDTIQAYRHNPTVADAPEVWNRVARQELEGNVRLIDKTLREAVPAALREDYERAAGEALAALAGFDEFLKNDLAKRRGDWRLGRENYAKKFRYVIATDAGPDQVLDEAEKEFEQVRRQMYQIAVQLHQKMYPRATDRSDPDTVIRQVLDKIAERRPTPETYVAEARRDLKEATDFVARRGLVPLLTGNNLQVIPTPEFMRGIYSVGGFNPAPPLDARAGAGRLLLDHADSAGLAKGPDRLQAPRVQLLRAEVAHHPRGHAGPLRPVRIRQPRRAGEPAPGPGAVRQRAVHRGLGGLRDRDDAR